jgi:hypothetical protein
LVKAEVSVPEQGGPKHLGRLAIILLLLFALMTVKSIHFGNHKGETTLKQAVNMAYREASAWSRHPQLVYAVSTDNDDYSTTQGRGKNGRRLNWNIVFSGKEQDSNLLVAVRHGIIAYTEELNFPMTAPINRQALKIDSPAVLGLPNIVNYQRAHQIDAVHFELIAQKFPMLRVYLRQADGRYHVTCFNEQNGQSLVK